jgi:hypothetical protein
MYKRDVTPRSQVVVKLLMMTTLAATAIAQPSESIPSLLLRFDREHDPAQKEHLLRTVTDQDRGAGPALLRLARSTRNWDTRWMAMRGMATLHYTACAPFLKASLKDSDSAIRANAARALGDLRIRNAAAPLLAMFAAEQEPGAVQQASLALHLLDIKAAAPYIRDKLPRFTGQTRSWLIQALGALGGDRDAPLIAGYLDFSDIASAMDAEAATYALEELAGVSFGPHAMGATTLPPPETLVARAWWASHKTLWPSCDDCRRK